MSTSASVCLGGVVALAASVLAALAVPQPRPEQPDPAARSIRFLDVAYPTLRAGAAKFVLGGGVYRSGPWLRDFGIQIDDRIDYQAPSITEANGRRFPREVFFHANVWFDNQGLRAWLTRGRFVHYAEREDFAEAAHKHVWSDAQTLTELRERGAAYGPEASATVTRMVPSAAAVSDLVGCPMREPSVTFDVPTPEERAQRLPLVWRAAYEPMRAGCQSYVLDIEPFGAQMVALRRR